ncbi:hypothetical protein OEZ86_010930 [Tetradesmus obliquus]|nr:hypothetical protein OEZ86_010930 [Tetradesmus obliquus]
MVGRVIGKSGETIKALQTYTGALIQIDQTVEPTKVTISGTPHSLSLAVSMVTDIVKGTFKGFALLRQITNPGGARPGPVANPMAQPRPVYAPGYGLIPPSQLYGADERTAGVVPVNYGGRSTQAAVGWAPGQVTPSQMILNMPPAGVVRPMGQPGMLGGEEAMMGPMPGYAAGMAPMYAYPPEYGMPGMMQAPEVMYGDPNGMMGGGGLAGSQARLYHAAGGPKAAGGPGGQGRSNGPAKSSSAGDMAGDVMGSGAPLQGGNWVQVMDPDGKVYYLNQGQQ